MADSSLVGLILKSKPMKHSWAVAKNMHADKKLRYEQQGGAQGKTIVQGFLDRDLRKVRAKIVPNVKRETLPS